MHYEFLKGFPKRMRTVGRYALLISGISRREIFKKLGLETLDQQVSLVFAVLLYVMEQSLKEENCTIEDIAAFLDDLNSRYYLLPWSFEDCQELSDTIINVILGNEGLIMFFEGYDFEQGEPVPLHISFVANRVIYPDGDGKGDRKTSYYLTEEGYSLLLGTLEVEDNLKLTIQEMIFKLHLEKQSYDKALDDVKNVFNLLKIQIQKIQQAMNVIRHNVLDYRVEEYESITREDLETIRGTNEKFKGYRETVKARAKELEESRFDTARLGEKEEENLANLRDIEGYLTRAIDLHMTILSGHFDLQGLYALELDRAADLKMVKRFSLRKELYEKILENPTCLGNMDVFLRPLFTKDLSKTFSLAKAAVPQTTRAEEEEGEEEMEDFDPDSYLARQRQEQYIRKMKYKNCLQVLLEYAARGEGTLSSISSALTEADRAKLLPTAEIFKEVAVELLTTRRVDMTALRRERSENIAAETEGFSLAETLFLILDRRPSWEKSLRSITFTRLFEEPPVLLPHVTDEKGRLRTLRCQDMSIELAWEGGTAPEDCVPAAFPEGGEGGDNDGY